MKTHRAFNRDGREVSVTVPAKSTFVLVVPGRGSFDGLESIAAASAKYAELRDESGEGASTLPNGKVLELDETGDTLDAFHVSYNAKVWNGPSSLVFNPYA